VENEGMAFGLSFGGGIGKLMLTLFRIIVIGFIAYYMYHQIKSNKASMLFVVCLSMVFAGAIGNIIDSVFYGVVFSESAPMQVATLFPATGGYAPLLKGKVVDMFYFPLFQGFLPESIPFFGGKYVEFFPYIFNLADAYISVGVGILLVFQRRIFG
jgi:signal peptidase II